MTDQREFFVSYAGEMTPHDREALTRTDRMFFKNEGAIVAGGRARGNRSYACVRTTPRRRCSWLRRRSAVDRAAFAPGRRSRESDTGSTE